MRMYFVFLSFSSFFEPQQGFEGGKGKGAEGRWMSLVTRRQMEIASGGMTRAVDYARGGALHCSRLSPRFPCSLVG